MRVHDYRKIYMTIAIGRLEMISGLDSIRFICVIYKSWSSCWFSYVNVAAADAFDDRTKNWFVNRRTKFFHSLKQAHIRFQHAYTNPQSPMISSQRVFLLWYFRTISIHRSIDLLTGHSLLCSPNNSLMSIHKSDRFNWKNWIAACALWWFTSVLNGKTMEIREPRICICSSAHVFLSDRCISNGSVWVVVVIACLVCFYCFCRFVSTPLFCCVVGVVVALLFQGI